ncbi:protein kinase [Kitasatospora sp. NPDC127067]|uniref:protein kinase domain-containing protein n=1 Tax=Kitasatospora sp. NPDC127067 TaxID=3347126 RepID=UPI003661C3E2
MRSGEVLNGRYRLEKRLGAGGFGVVWRAFDPQVQRAVAVKVGVPRSMVDGLRMTREARFNGNLPHPHIATVFDFGEADRDGERILYLVMELIDGEALSAVLSRGLPPLESALEWAAQICSALAAAHDAGVIHRDIKPANVMITRAGTVKVLDFGIARHRAGVTRLTDEDTIIGSLPYMAPERWTNKDVDGRADLYALGCVLLELSTGTLPFHGEEWQELYVQHATAEPPAPSSLRPGLPAALDGLVRELLAKDPADRPGGARQVEHRLRAILDDAAARTRGATQRDGQGPRAVRTAEPRAPRAPRRRALAGAAAVAAVAASLLAVGVWQFLPSAVGRNVGPGPEQPSGSGGIPAAAGSPAVQSSSPIPTPTPTPTPSPTPTPTPSAAPAPEPSSLPPAPRPSDPGATSPVAPTAAPKPPSPPTGWFRFTNAATRMCLSVPDGSRQAAEGLVQEDCGRGPEQFWQLTAEGQGGAGPLYSIRNGNSGLCLSVDAAHKEVGAVITQYPCGDESHHLFPDQYWTLHYDPTYYAWQLISNNSDKCAAVRQAGGQREQALQLTCGSDAWLLWRT